MGRRQGATSRWWKTIRDGAISFCTHCVCLTPCAISTELVYRRIATKVILKAGMWIEFRQGPRFVPSHTLKPGRGCVNRSPIVGLLYQTAAARLSIGALASARGGGGRRRARSRRICRPRGGGWDGGREGGSRRMGRGGRESRWKRVFADGNNTIPPPIFCIAPYTIISARSRIAAKVFLEAGIREVFRRIPRDTLPSYALNTVLGSVNCSSIISLTDARAAALFWVGIFASNWRREQSFIVRCR